MNTLQTPRADDFEIRKRTERMEDIATEGRRFVKLFKRAYSGEALRHNAAWRSDVVFFERYLSKPILATFWVIFSLGIVSPLQPKKPDCYLYATLSRIGIETHGKEHKSQKAHESKNENVEKHLCLLAK